MLLAVVEQEQHLIDSISLDCISVRVRRCCKAVFGRDEEQLSAGQYIMQCADVFFYQVN
jgi:hypothetical protein